MFCLCKKNNNNNNKKNKNNHKHYCHKRKCHNFETKSSSSSELKINNKKCEKKNKIKQNNKYYLNINKMKNDIILLKHSKSGSDLIEECFSLNNEDGLKFIKITERIFALLFQSGSDAIYRNNIKSICERLKKIFFDKYKIFNLSQKRSDLGRANQQGIVLEFGWPDPLSPPLDRLCSICKQLENHLNNSKENIAIIHCKGGIYRIGIVISAFMNYTNICSSEENLPDRFSMKLFTEKYIGVNTQPSHKRYINYFINLLTGITKVYPSPIYLIYISLFKLFSGQTVKLKLYERMKPIWSSGKIILKENNLIEIFGGNNNKQSLRGDILLKCYQSINEKQLLFQCQFNTCALGMESFNNNITKIFFSKMELDCLNNSIFIDNNANLELAFCENKRNNNNTRRGKSSSPRLYQQLSGGDFSRADSYENFEKDEDERSLSLPIGINNNNKEYLNENNFQKLNDEIKLLSNKQENEIENNLNKSKNQSLTTDGADSGIGSDSPKVISNQLILPKEEQQQSDSELKLINMPPPIPPKSSNIINKHSSFTENDKKEEGNDQQRIEKYNNNLNEKEEEEEEQNYLMRSAFEDSTIGRDHSVLPPGARSSRKHSPHTSIDGGGGGTSASSGDERSKRRVIISPMVQPQLVASGRYDPNSRCFSYVPAKSLKEHYKAPKKPSLKRRTSVIEPADLEVSPLEAKMALENFGLQSSSSETYRRTETPKWETEIDKLTGGKVENYRPRRASTTGTPVGHIQRDYIRSPSAAQANSPQNDWNYYNQQKRQEKSQQLNLPKINANYNNYQKSNENIEDKWPNISTKRISRAQMPNRDNYQMTTSMPSSTEQPMIIEQSKRVTPTLLQKTSSPCIGSIRRHPIPGVRPSPRRSEMDTLCDPEFYLSYSSQKKQQLQSKEGEFLSKSVPNGKEFNQMALIELQRDDVKELIAQHTSNNNNLNYFNNTSSIRRSQTPQNPLITSSKELGGAKPLKINDEYRTRNCRSVNSTPLIGNRRLFLHKEFDEPLTDPECCAEDWLNTKLEALKGRRIEQPIAKNKYEAEKFLLEELKNKTKKLISEKNKKENEDGNDDPLEEYKKEEQILKNTKLPFLALDGLRKANRYLQNERAKQNIFGQNTSSFKKDFPEFIIQQQRSLSAAPINNNNFNNKQNNYSYNSYNIPLQYNKRGITPTGQIIIEKPPTPPLIIKGENNNRERSKSPHNSKLFLKNSKKSLFDEIEEPLQSTSIYSSSAVNPNLLALRQSLYEKERQRMGLTNNNELIDSKNNKWEQLSGLNKNIENLNFQQNNNNFISSSNNRSVKPILKRNTTLQQQYNNGNESPILLNKKQLQNYNEENNSSQKEEINNNWIIIDRSDTPQFPLISERETPIPYHPLLYKNEEYNNQLKLTKNIINQSILTNRIDNNFTPHSMYGNGFGRRSSLNSIDSVDVIHHHPIFVKDTSRFWYKPKISREEAISMLKNKSPGTFIVRDSNSFPGAFGLALKVSQPPAGVSPADGNELVRHFLIEPSPKGVRLKGCSNEPVFGTLAALVYQHSITPLALPCRLILPSIDPASNPENINSNQALLERGAACNVTYLCSVDTESLTGPEAVRRSTSFALKLLLRNEVRAVPVHIKVSLQGITLTDNTRTLFFRRHYPVNSVTFAGIDPESRFFDNNNVIQLPPTYVRQATMFGFVAHKNANNGFNGGNNIENSCHIFAELDPDQPASAVVRFITNVMMPAGRIQLQQKHQ